MSEEKALLVSVADAVVDILRMMNERSIPCDRKATRMIKEIRDRVMALEKLDGDLISNRVSKEMA